MLACIYYLALPALAFAPMLAVTAAVQTDELSEAKEAGGDEAELDQLVRLLGLTPMQRREFSIEFARYQERLLDIKAMPNSSTTDRMLKGPRRRALRADLDSWIKSRLLRPQISRYESYLSRRSKELYDEQVTNRVEKVTREYSLGPRQRYRARVIYNDQLKAMHAAADALYAALRERPETPQLKEKRAKLERELDATRERLKSDIAELLRPDQRDSYKKKEDF